MEDEVQPEATQASQAESPAPESPSPETPRAAEIALNEVHVVTVTAPAQPVPVAPPPDKAARPETQEPRKQEGQRPHGQQPHGQPGQGREPRPPRGDRPPGDRGPDRGGDRGDRRDMRPGGGRPFEGPPEIDIEKLISDSLYLDNHAHAVVARMRDMDSGTKSQLRRLYNAVRRAVRAPESDRQHQFVMLRARLAYTIARHSLRSLDALERLLLQVTRKNDARGYERFKDLFEAIVAYNE
jgi:CRISPR type III-A-associated protein Csm2